MEDSPDGGVGPGSSPVFVKEESPEEDEDRPASFGGENLVRYAVSSLHILELADQFHRGDRYVSPSRFVTSEAALPNCDLPHGLEWCLSSSVENPAVTVESFDGLYDSPEPIELQSIPAKEEGNHGFDGHKTVGRSMRKRTLSDPSRRARDVASVADSDEDYRSIVQKLLDLDSEVDRDTIFSSAEEANSAAPETEASSIDLTVPDTLEQEKAIVKALFNAMKRVDLALDNRNMVRPFEEGKYSDQRIEMTCWNILVRADHSFLFVLPSLCLALLLTLDKDGSHTPPNARSVAVNVS